MNGTPLTRRRLLTDLGACAAATACSGRVIAAAATAVVDVHHHFLPPFYKEPASAWLQANASNLDQVLGWAPERSLEAMDRAGVDRSVLSISAPGIPGEGSARATLARRCNEYAARLAADHPGRFAFFAALPMPDVAASIAEIGHAFDELDAAGVGLLSNYGGAYLGRQDFLPLFDALNERSAVVYVHPTSAPCCHGLVPGVLDALHEFPVDTGRTITSLLWQGVLSRYTDIRFIFSHGAGSLPMIAARIASAGFINPAIADNVAGNPLAELARLYVDTASVETPFAIAALRELVGDEHILYGTDFPWGNLERSLAGLKSRIRAGELADGVLGQHADALLRLAA